jgi:hypothetical protein
MQPQHDYVQHQGVEIDLSPRFSSVQMEAAGTIDPIRAATSIVRSATTTIYSPKPIKPVRSAVSSIVVNTESTAFCLNPAARSFTPFRLNPAAPPFIPSVPVPVVTRCKVHFSLHVVFKDTAKRKPTSTVASTAETFRKSKADDHNSASYLGVPIMSSMLKHQKLAIKLLATIKALEKNLDLPGKQLQLNHQRAAAERELRNTQRDPRSIKQDLDDLESVLKFLDKTQGDLDELVNSVRLDRECYRQAMVDQGFLCENDGSFPGRSGDYVQG